MHTYYQSHRDVTGRTDKTLRGLECSTIDIESGPSNLVCIWALSARPYIFRIISQYRFRLLFLFPQNNSKVEKEAKVWSQWWSPCLLCSFDHQHRQHHNLVTQVWKKCHFTFVNIVGDQEGNFVIFYFLVSRVPMSQHYNYVLITIWNWFWAVSCVLVMCLKSKLGNPNDGEIVMRKIK